MGDRTVSVWLKAQVADYVAKMTQAGKATKDFKATLADASKADALDELGRTALVTGGLLTAAFLVPAKAAADFDKAMSSVSAATHASVSEMDQLSKAALQAGADTAFSAVDAAKGITELAKAGVSTADILGGGLKGALDLAAAGELSVADAAEVAATALAQFKLSGKDLPHVADLLAAGAGKAQGEVSDMAAALKMGGLVASQFGVSVDDTVGTLASFAKAGLIGSDAGTSFKTMLLHLAAPSKVAAAAMREIGLEVYDTSGEFIGMERLAGELQTRLAGLTGEQRNAALATIFGADAVRAANVLYTEGASGIANWRSEVSEAGYATDTANRKLDNLAGDLEKFKGSVEVNLIKAGTGANQILRGLVQNAEQAVDAVGSLPTPVMAAGVGLAGIAGAALLVGGGLSMAVVKMHDTKKALAEIEVGGGRAEKSMIGVARGAGRMAAALAATQVVGASFGKDINPQIASLNKGMIAWIETGKAGGEAARLFGDDLELLKYDLDQLGNWDTSGAKIVEGLTGLGSLFDKSIVHSTERLASYDQVLTAMVQSGNVDMAAQGFEKLAKLAKEEGTSLEELKAAFPGYQAALDGASKSELTAIKITQDHEKATRSMGGSIADAIKLFGSLKDVLDNLNGEARAYDRALNTAEAAVDDLTASVAENGTTLDRNTEKGRANREQILKGTEAAEDAAQAVYDHNVARLGEIGATRLAVETYQRYIDGLKAGLPATKENRAEWDLLWASVSNIPPLVATKVKVEIPPEALPAVKAIDDAIKGMRDKQVKVTESGSAEGEARASRLQAQIAALQDKRVLIIEEGAGPAAVEVQRLDSEIRELQGRQVEVSESGAADAEIRVQRMQAAIDRLDNKRIMIEAQVNARIYETRDYVDLRDFRETRGQRWGGVNVHARRGLVSAGVYPAGPTQYAFAEPETGGEIFAPRQGDLGRTRSIVEYGVKNWWGGSVSWGGKGGGTVVNVGGITIQDSGSPQATGAEVIARIRQYEQTNGAGWRGGS